MFHGIDKSWAINSMYVFQSDIYIYIYSFCLFVCLLVFFFLASIGPSASLLICIAYTNILVVNRKMPVYSDANLAI